jgi:hypothetical protein
MGANRITCGGLERLSESEVAAIRKQWAARPPGRSVTLKTIGAQFHRSHHTIRNIIRGQKYAKAS